VLTLALSLAGCTVQSKASAAGGSAGGTSPAAVGSSAPGVTADTIKIGVAYLDLASVKQFVNIDQGDYQATFQALIDKVNADGGIQGRKVIPVYGKVNLLSASAAQETCVKLTQDDHVFAVLAVITGVDQALCYAKTHHTALVGGLQSHAAAAQATAPWFAYNSDGDAAADVVKVLSQRGDLTGRKVAVAAINFDQATVQNNVLPALQSAGVTPVATGYIPASGTDVAAFEQQSDVVLQKAQAAGADTLLIVGGAAQVLPQVIEKGTWRPRLLFTAEPVAYLGDKGARDFSILNGSVTAAQITDWNDPALQDCITTMTKADPSLAGKLVDPNTVPSGQPAPGYALQQACETVTLFKAIADKAGKNLDYSTFQQAGFGLGRIHLPGFKDDAAYSQQLPSGGIPVRAMVYDAASKSYVPAGS
jgi:hypothetical protein